MTALQWALLIFGVVAVVAIYFYSRRERRSGEVFGPEAEEPAPREPGRAAPSPFDRQMDIFSSTGSFDEFGVGKPRRISPELGIPSGPVDEDDDLPPPTLGNSRSARFEPEPEPEEAPADQSPPPAPAPPPEKLVSLLIAEREGTQILGENIHAALRAQGLQYGMRQIYHRMVAGKPVFSVASLLKPGVLDPDQARGFATPGLAVFMVLPGPVKANDAFSDMLKTAQALAQSLNAEVYDGRKKPLNSAAILQLRSEVDAWARTHGL